MAMKKCSKSFEIFRAQAKIFTTASKNERLLKAEKHENATEKLPFAECKLPNFDPWDRELVKVISVNFDPLKVSFEKRIVNIYCQIFTLSLVMN